MTGVPTGFTDLDTLTNGLHPGQLIVVAGRPGPGQGARARHAARRRPPAGRRWARSQPGDELLGRRRPPGDGSSPRPRSCTAGPATRSSSPTARCSSPTRSTSGSPTPAPRAGRRDRAPAVRTTAELAPTRAVRDRRRPRQPLGPHHRAAAAARGRAAAAPVRPRRLAGRRPHARARASPRRTRSWSCTSRRRGSRWSPQSGAPPVRAAPAGSPVPLEARACVVCGRRSCAGDPQVRTCGRAAVVAAALGRPAPDRPVPTAAGRARVAALPGLPRRPRDRARRCCARLGVLGDKHIPTAYLRASEAQRRALLAGPARHRRHRHRTGNVQLAVTSRRLAAGVQRAGAQPGLPLHA